MANRPVFASVLNPNSVAKVFRYDVEFEWNKGLARSQKKKNVKALHDAFIKRKGNVADMLLEVSSLSDLDLGVKLSAFNLDLDLEAMLAKLEHREAVGSRMIKVEVAYQGAKCIDGEGPFLDILDMDSKEAKRDSRLKAGPLTGFKLGECSFSLFPKTAFYNFLYLNALTQTQNRALWMEASSYIYFTDLNFNPAKGIACQADALALGVTLSNRKQLEIALESFDFFLAYGYNLK